MSDEREDRTEDLRRETLDASVGGVVAGPAQADVLAWVAERWPDCTGPLWRAAKLCEEAGEVMGAVVKMHEGRKTLADLAQETAQVVICAMALAESAGFGLDAAVSDEFARCAGPAWATFDVAVVDAAARDHEQTSRCLSACTRPPDDVVWLHKGHTLVCPSCARRVGLHGGVIARHFRPEALR